MSNEQPEKVVPIQDSEYPVRLKNITETTTIPYYIGATTNRGPIYLIFNAKNSKGTKSTTLFFFKDVKIHSYFSEFKQ